MTEITTPRPFVHSEDGLRVASTDIARCRRRAQATLKLIQTHAASLEEFGRVESETRPLATASGNTAQYRSRTRGSPEVIRYSDFTVATK